MDVVPTVAKEIVFRFHKKMNAGGGAAEGTAQQAPPPAATATTDDTTSQQQQQCSRSGTAAVTTELAMLLTRLWLLGSSKIDEAGNVGDSAENMEAMVEDIVDFLQQCSTANLATVSLQSSSYALKANLRNKRRTEDVKREAIGTRLVESILGKRTNVTADEVLGDITLYILHRYDQLDSSTDSNLPAHKETAAVLCSALPRPQVMTFTRQDSVEKQRQLEELRRIVWGIRIFNKEEGKTSGSGIRNVHEMVEEPLASIDDKLRSELHRLEEKITRMLAVLQSPTCPLKPEEQKLLREEYHHSLQVQHNLLTVRCMHRTLSNRLHSGILPKFDNALSELRALFSKSKPATTGNDGEKKSDVVPKRVVYPVFVDLADAYESAVRTVEEFEEAESLLQLTLNSESSYTSSLPERLAEDALARAARYPPIEDRAALVADVNEQLTATAHNLGAAYGDYRLYYTDALPENADAVAIECFPQSLCGFRGFCPVTYAQTGLLVTGKISMQEDPAAPGFIVIEGGQGRWALPRPRHLAFASEAAMREFAADPTRFMLACIQTCSHEEPGVTLLMGLLDRLPRELYIEGSRSFDSLTAPTDASLVADNKKEVGTQTGQIDSYFDHNYRWNEWDLRREALKLANLLNMRTHSTQTVASHYRRDRTTQAAPPKEGGTQTMPDAATQPPRVVQYLKGLRGTKSSEIEQVQRTILY